MAFIDFLLNVAALLLWLSWRSVRLEALVRNPPATLAGTLRRAEPHRIQSWPFLAGLVVVVGLRALLCVEFASPGEWTPRLDLGLILLPFRSDLLAHTSLYSFLSFLRLLVIFYSWLIALVILNARTAGADPILKLLRLHLGPLARWPRAVQLLFPLLATICLWVASHPLLAYLGVIGHTHSIFRMIEQGALIGLGLFFTLKFLLPPFLFLHLILSYVYLGSHPVWDFISITARNLLAPLQWLRVGKVDLSPILGVAIIFGMLHWLPNIALVELARHNLVLWPR